MKKYAEKLVRGNNNIDWTLSELSIRTVDDVIENLKLLAIPSTGGRRKHKTRRNRKQRKHRTRKH